LKRGDRGAGSAGQVSGEEVFGVSAE